MIPVGSMSTEAIRRRMDTGCVGRQLYLFGEVDSTNDLLRRLAGSGAADGTVVLAEGQQRGRGRRGQEWFSPSGVNVYASALFRDGVTSGEAPLFSLIAGLAIADAIKALGLPTAIRWPNDVLVGAKKVAVSLVEDVNRGAAVDSVVVGAGVNVNVDAMSLGSALGAESAPATSLAAALGREIDRNAFTASYLNRLDAWVVRYRANGVAPILAAWRDRDVLTGCRVLARGQGRAFEGLVKGVNDDAYLIVEGASGERRVLLAEEIRVL